VPGQSCLLRRLVRWLSFAVFCNLMRNSSIILLVCMLPQGCSRSVPEYATKEAIQRNYTKQMNRVDSYAQDFTKYQHGALHFPPQGTSIQA